MMPGNPVVGGTVLRRAAIESPNFVTGVSGWDINQDGSAEFNNLTIRGEFDGVNFVINSAGAFFYNGAPAFGNLILSIAKAGGTDAHGNTYVNGFVSYNQVAPFGFWAVQHSGTNIAFLNSPTAGGVYTQTASFSGDNNGNLFLNYIGSLSANGAVSIAASLAAGLILTLQNTHSAPTNPALQIISQAANDNSLGIMVSGDTFNRIKMTTAALLFGSGSGAQDTQLYRSSAGVFGADTILANVGGSVEVWNTLGTPGITGWTSDHGRYRFANDGCVEFDIILHSNAVAHGSSITTYPNTLPAQYRPAFNRVCPLGIDTNITAADPYPRLAISTAGVVKIAIPSVGAATTEIGGTFHMTLD